MIENIFTMSEIAEKLGLDISSVWRYLHRERNPLIFSRAQSKPIVFKNDFIEWCLMEAEFIKKNPDHRRKLRRETLLKIIKNANEANAKNMSLVR